ncbi:MAG TPA: NTP transferase domain-containing protein [Candidatus Kapabacteria bacterium]|nr:NTP transferase domain-containing protein [Candidatus Kapabacteria bacterium]
MATVLLQARLGSVRLPGKVLLPILGKPMLHYTVETLKLSPAVDRVVLVIPMNPADDPLVDFALQHDIPCFRGSEQNVLDRFYRAACLFKDRYYFRATGDNPILDYGHPQRLLTHLIERGCDYTGERGMPVGSVVEGFTFEALEKCFKEAAAVEDLEHVTLYMKRSGRFNVSYIDAPAACYLPQLRLTVDYREDFERVTGIIEDLYREKVPLFEEVIAFSKKQGWG